MTQNSCNEASIGGRKLRADERAFLSHLRVAFYLLQTIRLVVLSSRRWIMDMQKHVNVEWFIQRSCLNKKSLSKDRADRAVDKAAKGNTMVYYYKCKFCSSFHMTSKPPNDAHLRYEVI